MSWFNEEVIGSLGMKIFLVWLTWKTFYQNITNNCLKYIDLVFRCDIMYLDKGVDENDDWEIE